MADKDLPAVTVIGAGSVGLLLAGDLAAAGARTTVVARTRAQAEAIGRYGIAVREADGSRRVSHPASTWADETPARGGSADWVVLCVKQPDLDDRICGIALGHAGAAGRILAVQNGIGHEEWLAERIERSRLRVAVTTIGARRTGAAGVDRTGRGMTLIGRADDNGAGAGRARQAGVAAPDESDERFMRLLRAAGWSCEWTDDLRRLLWDKLTVNAIINPLTALLRVPNGRLASSPDTKRLMRELYGEIERLRVAEGVPAGPDMWERVLEVCRRTAANRSSMLQDVERGRPTELDWITGSLLRSAERRGVAMPANRTVYLLLKAGLSTGTEVERDVRHLGMDC